MQPPCLETDRLLLRDLRPGDVAPHVASTRDAEVQYFLGGVQAPYDAFVALAAHAGQWALRGYGDWAVAPREDPDAYLGRVGLWHPEGWPGLEVGWRLDRAAWGHGYATEAARAAIGWAWTVLDVAELISLIAPENHASQRVARRLGHVPAETLQVAGAVGVRHVLARPAGELAWALREATPQDASRVAHAVRQAFGRYRDISPPGWAPGEHDDEDEAAALAHPHYRCVISEPGGVLAGHVGWWPAVDSRHPYEDPGLIHLRQLFVHPGWWGTGLAARLLSIATDASAAAGFTGMRLFTPAAQGRARRFYERHGWRATGPPREDERFGMPTIEYARNL
jgi:RimJ/RimL family protein N-acetyltransferase/GNAT superfamily N-acetyltransferase